jgi:hypothetical protein
MRKAAILLLGLILVTANGAFARPRFMSRGDAVADAQRRLGLDGKATPPSGSNTVTYEGNVTLTLVSGNFGAVLMDAAEIRFECDSQAYQLGCAYTATRDHLLVYGHLRSYLSCRHDGTDNEVVVNLIYKRTTHQCGDLGTCQTWVLLTQ